MNPCYYKDYYTDEIKWGKPITLDEICFLKPYMAYSGTAGSEEGAVLVFAHNVREVKKVSYKEIICWGVDYVDIRVNFLENKAFLYKEAILEKLELGIPHVIDSPSACKACEFWGRELNEDGYCRRCEIEREENEEWVHDPEMGAR